MNRGTDLLDDPRWLDDTDSLWREVGGLRDELGHFVWKLNFPQTINFTATRNYKWDKQRRRGGRFVEFDRKSINKFGP